MKGYAVTAAVELETPSGYHGTRQVPTFYLLANVQGIVSAAHAIKIAREVIGGTIVTISAVPTVIGDAPEDVSITDAVATYERTWPD